MAWQIPLMLAIGYLLGSVPFGLIVGRLHGGVDIREYGSGKTGFTNSLRTMGLAPSILVLLGDLAKGLVPAIIGRFVFDSAGLAALGAGAAIAGHVFPVFAGFRGGRGVTTSFGGLLVMVPLAAAILPPIAALIVIATRYMSLMSILGTIVACAIVVVLVALGWAEAEYAVYVGLASLLILVMHRPNILRLLHGTEPKLGKGGGRRPPAAARLK